jgi:hypothetical protein
MEDEVDYFDIDLALREHKHDLSALFPQHGQTAVISPPQSGEVPSATPISEGQASSSEDHNVLDIAKRVRSKFIAIPKCRHWAGPDISTLQLFVWY